MTILNYLENNAKNDPNKVALVEIEAHTRKREEITWAQFDNLANKVAKNLLQLGIKKEAKISILMKNRLEWLPIYFGILKSSAIASPLNFRFSEKEIEYAINLVESKVFFFEEEYIDYINIIKKSIDKTIKYYVFVGEEEKAPDFAISYAEFLNIQSDKNFPEIKEKDKAAIYFTSGTTALPKAILLKHKNLLFAAKLENKHHGQNKDDNFLCIPPLYHTGAKMHWFGNLVVGAKCIILKGVCAEDVIDIISQERVSIVWLLVPWIHDIIISIETGKVKLENYNLSQWKIMHSGAQPIPPALIKKWLKIFPHHKYDTNYGLTETTGPGCVHLGLENINKIGSIGMAGWNWETKIVDEKGEELPLGKTGELIVKGEGNMVEYYKNLEETQKTLRNGWLFTGDMAKYDEDGYIWLVDRKKDMVISGGENIYPVQIENFLMEHEKIHDVAIIGTPDERLGETVTAIIKVKENKNLSEKEVNKFCEKLARYKRPKKIFFDDVPRNPTGKIEKPKLREKYC